MGRWCAGEAAARGAVGVEEEVDAAAILSRSSSCGMVNDNVEFMNVEGIDWRRAEGKEGKEGIEEDHVCLCNVDLRSWMGMGSRDVKREDKTELAGKGGGREAERKGVFLRSFVPSFCSLWLVHGGTRAIAIQERHGAQWGHTHTHTHMYNHASFNNKKKLKHSHTSPTPLFTTP